MPSSGRTTTSAAWQLNHRYHVTTLNPFHRPTSAYSPKTFTYAGPCLLEHRGVQVFKNAQHASWDYVFQGVTITQRAGFTAASAREVIDNILDGKGNEWRPENVCEHLRKHGHTPKSYADAS